jgi:protein-L-isoaspartate(D-aspartate) O-methyltransferase
MSLSENASALERARFNMVEQQVRTWDVLDYRILDVLHAMPREDFVQAPHQHLAYADVELPVPGASGGEKLFKPVIDGRILQSLDLNGSEDVLEVGAGSGYLTACLAKLARQVQSVEIDAQIAGAARAAIKKQNLFNVTLHQADALKGFTPSHQFDVIVLGAAVVDLPAQIWNWLKPNGRVFAVRGMSPVMEAVLMRVGSHAPMVQSLFETDLPYLHGMEPKKKFVF